MDWPERTEHSRSSERSTAAAPDPGRNGLLVTAHAQRGMWMCDRRPMSIHEVAASGVAARRTEMCAYTVVYTAVGALAST